MSEGQEADLCQSIVFDFLGTFYIHYTASAVPSAKD